jgi:hypothetical protein
MPGGLVVGGAEVVECGVPAAGVLEALEVGEHRVGQVLADGPGVPVEQFGLQGCEEALGQAVVEAMTSRREICSGLHAVAQRRSARCGLFNPFHVVGGPAAGRPSGRRSCPSSRVCTYSVNRGLVASLAGFGRRAAVWAFHCATVARSWILPLRVAALRRSSREIVLW